MIIAYRSLQENLSLLELSETATKKDPTYAKVSTLY